MIDDTFEDIDQLERLFAEAGDDDEYSAPQQDPFNPTPSTSGSRTPRESGFKIDFNNIQAENSKRKAGETSSFKEKPTVKKVETKVDDYFEKTSVYTDPVFGLRISKPLISSTVLLERMQGRTPISFARIRHHTDHGDKTMDWVFAG